MFGYITFIWLYIGHTGVIMEGGHIVGYSFLRVEKFGELVKWLVI